MHTKRVLALVLITALTLSPVTVATAAALDQPESSAHAVSSVASGPGPSAVGPMGSIGVHGHWEIEVRNPDGSLVTRREFDNALFDHGANILPLLLSGAVVPAPWIVFFYGAPTPCFPYPGDNQKCFILEGRLPVPASTNGISKNLVVTTDPLKLSGSITVPLAGSITTVQTSLDICSGSPPASCLGGATVAIRNNLATSSAWFTGTNIAPINVLAGQLVTFTITFTFSSGP